MKLWRFVGGRRAHARFVDQRPGKAEERLDLISRNAGPRSCDNPARIFDRSASFHLFNDFVAIITILSTTSWFNYLRDNVRLVRKENG